MAATRAMWKGYLKLALVTCPISLYAGSGGGGRVSFNQINKKTGNRIRQQLVDEVTRQPVEAEDKVRGYEYERGKYLIVEDDELAAVRVESNHTIEITSFVPRAQIDERYLDSKYYIAPSDKVGQDAFAVIREGMRAKKMVGLATIVFRSGGREYPVMIEPWDRGMVVTTLHYPREIRDTKDCFDDIPELTLTPDLVQLAEQLIDSKTADFEPSQFVDRYEDAVVEMLKQKQAGVPVAKDVPAERPRNQVDLMAALRGSLADQTKKQPVPSIEAKKPARKRKASSNG